MKSATIIMWFLAVALTALAYLKGGQHFAGLKAGGKMMLQVFPILLASFAVAGLVQVMVPREFISRWLGEASGMKGILIASAAGTVSAPGGPYVSFPLVAAMYKAGAGIGPVVAFVTSWSLLSAMRIPLEVAIIGPRVTLIRLACNIFLPPVAGYMASAFFGRIA